MNEKPPEGLAPFAAVISIAVRLFLTFTRPENRAQGQTLREVLHEHLIGTRGASTRRHPLQPG